MDYSSAPLKWHGLGSVRKLICWILKCDCQTVHVVGHNEGEFSFFVGPINYSFSEDNLDVLDWDLIRATDNFSCKAMSECSGDESIEPGKKSTVKLLKFPSPSATLYHPLLNKEKVQENDQLDEDYLA